MCKVAIALIDEIEVIRIDGMVYIKLDYTNLVEPTIEDEKIEIEVVENIKRAAMAKLARVGLTPEEMKALGLV